MSTLRTYLDFSITPQPDEATCGPTCLHAVYRFYHDAIPLQQIIAEVPQVSGGGTFAVHLALHALRRGYRATIYTCNLQMFDPSWFKPGAPPMRERLLAQMKAKPIPKLHGAIRAYIEFLERGGQVFMQDITADLLQQRLALRRPLITGLSATWLYQSMRERPSDCEDDDAAGEPTGHFVVIHGLDAEARRAYIADPWALHPFPTGHGYTADLDHLISAILLGIVTYDAKLLIIEPPATHSSEPPGSPQSPESLGLPAPDAPAASQPAAPATSPRSELLTPATPPATALPHGPSR